MARSFTGSTVMASAANIAEQIGALTVCCWAKYSALRSTTNKSNTLVNQAFNTFSWGDETFSLSLDGSKFMRLCWYATGLADEFTVSTSAASVNSGEWHHYCVTRSSGSTPTVKFYLDGVQLGTNVTATTAAGSFGSRELRIGGGNTSADSSTGWQGDIAEVGIWSSVLSTEIAALALGRPPGFFHTNLIAAIPLRGTTSNESIEGQSTTMFLNGTSASDGPSQLNYLASAPTEQLGSIPLHEVEVCPY